MVTDRRTNFRFLIDTGSDVCALPRPKNIDPSTYAVKRGEPPLPRLIAANDSPINTYGAITLTVSLGLRRDFTHQFIFADVGQPIIGLDLLKKYMLLVDPANDCLIDRETGLQSKGSPATGTICYSIKIATTHDPFDELLQQYPSVTASHNEPRQLPMTRTTHHIVTKGPPVTSRARRLNGEKYKAAKAEFDQLLKDGVIRPSDSNYASPFTW